MLRRHAAALATLVMLAAPAWAGADPEQEAAKSAIGFHAAGVILAIFASVLVCGGALLLLTVFLVPGITDRGAARVQRMPFRSFLAGLPVTALFLYLGRVVERHHVHPMILVPFLVIFLAGTTVVAQDLGRRTYALAGRGGSRLGSLLAGWSLFLTAYAIPVLGWFVVGPILLTAGTGGLLMELVARPTEPKSAPAPSSPPPPALPP